MTPSAWLIVDSAATPVTSTTSPRPRTNIAADGLVWWGFRAPADSLAAPQAEADRLVGFRKIVIAEII
jgi:hypothetical protein